MIMDCINEKAIIMEEKVINLRASRKKGALGSKGGIEMMSIQYLCMKFTEKNKNLYKKLKFKIYSFHKYIFYYKKKEETLFVLFI